MLAIQAFPHPIDPVEGEVGAIRNYSARLSRRLSRCFGRVNRSFGHALPTILTKPSSSRSLGIAVKMRRGQRKASSIDHFCVRQLRCLGGMWGGIFRGVVISNFGAGVVTRILKIRSATSFRRGEHPAFRIVPALLDADGDGFFGHLEDTRTTSDGPGEDC